MTTTESVRIQLNDALHLIQDAEATLREQSKFAIQRHISRQSVLYLASIVEAHLKNSLDILENTP